MSTLAPILIFTYKRLDTLKQAIKALQNNHLASESNLFIFSDAAKSKKDEHSVLDVREYIRSINGFKNITIIEALENKGLANSIISGVSQIISSYDKAIILEDDLVTSSNFLTFMNSSLEFYRNDKNVISISGYSPKIEFPKNYEYDAFMAKRSTSWGWATWKDRWEVVNWDIKDYKNYLPTIKRKLDFYQLGFNLYPMLKKQYNGKIDSWAIRWVFHQFKNNLLSVYPSTSKIKNIGFGEDATHTTRDNNYNSAIDTSNEHLLRLPKSDYQNKVIDVSFRKNYSFLTMLKNRIF